MESEDEEYSSSHRESNFVETYSHEKLRLYELNEENELLKEKILTL